MSAGGRRCSGCLGSGTRVSTVAAAPPPPACGEQVSIPGGKVGGMAGGSGQLVLLIQVGGPCFHHRGSYGEATVPGDSSWNASAESKRNSKDTSLLVASAMRPHAITLAGSQLKMTGGHLLACVSSTACLLPCHVSLGGCPVVITAP